MVLDQKVAALQAAEEQVEKAQALAERMRRQTDDLLAASARLMVEMDGLIERAKSLRAAQHVLRAAAREGQEKRAEEEKDANGSARLADT